MPLESSTGSAAVVAPAPRRPVRFERRPFSDVVVTGYPGTSGAAVHTAMVGLWASRLGRARRGRPGMPEPLAFHARTGELTTAWVPGTALADPSTPGATSFRSMEVGTLLADLHGSGIVVDRVRDRPTLAGVVRRQLADVAADHTTLGPVLDAFVEASLAIDRAWLHDEAPRRHVLSHGNLSPHTVLANHRGLVLLDFDHLQMAELERDLALWAARVWVDEGARDLPDTAALLGDLVSGYAATARRVPADRAALEVHLAVALVGVAHGLPSLRRDHFGRIRVLRAATALAERHLESAAARAL
ncbi:MAG: hypothetical protein ACJ714_07250 [Ornithinibacter sp.]